MKTKYVNRGNDGILRAMYCALNKKYFHNALPKDLPVLYSKDLVRERALGHTAIHKQTFRPLWIKLAWPLRTCHRTTRLTLLHEMVHVEQKHLRGHGKQFEKRMLELARHGAFKGVW